MHRRIYRWIAPIVIAGLLLGFVGSAALADKYLEEEKPGGGAMIWDTVAMRPLGMIATAVGSIFWVVSYPFAYLGGNTDETTEALVKTPYEWTFERPLGEF
jgi:hypothetical protein